jgi:protein SCO1
MKNASVFFRIFCLISGIALSLGISSEALADSSAKAGSALPVNTKPKALDGVGITEKLGAQISTQSLKFRNEMGEEVPFSNYFQSGRPVVLSLAYYTCPGLCGVVLNGLTESMKGLDWSIGQQYEVVNVSIDAKETSELAQKKKENYLAALGKPDAGKGWHFLTGTEENIQKLTQEVGFGFRWVQDENQYAHGAGVFVLTPEGKLSRILYGIQYRPADLKLSLLEASNGKIGTILDRIILFCYQYDPQLRKYSLGIMRMVQVGAIAVTLFLGLYLGLFWFNEKRNRRNAIQQTS